MFTLVPLVTIKIAKDLIVKVQLQLNSTSQYRHGWPWNWW